MPRRPKPSRYQEVYLNKNIAHETHEASTPKYILLSLNSSLHIYIIT